MPTNKKALPEVVVQGAQRSSSRSVEESTFASCVQYTPPKILAQVGGQMSDKKVVDSATWYKVPEPKPQGPSFVPASEMVRRKQESIAYMEADLAASGLTHEDM